MPLDRWDATNAQRWTAASFAILAFAVNMAGQGYAAVVAPGVFASTKVGLHYGMWFFVTYFVVAAATMLPMGRLADRLGPPRAIVLAMALYVVSDLVTMLSKSFEIVVASRALSALALTATAPLVWGLGSRLFREGKPRRLVFALLTAAIGAGSVLGSLLGGLSDGSTVPRWGFGVLALIAVVAGIGGFLTFPRFPPNAARDTDLFGIFLFITSLGVLLAGLKFGTAWGWTARSPIPELTWLGIPAVTTSLVGFALLLGFVLYERRRANHGQLMMFPAELFKGVGYTTGVIGFALLHFVFAGQVSLIPTLLHFIGKWTPGEVALVAAVLPLGIAVGALLRPTLSGWIGNSGTVATAGALGAGVFLWLIFDPLGEGPRHFAVSNALFGLAFGLALGVYGDIALRRVPDDTAGAGASMLHTTGNIAVGIGVMVFALSLTSVAAKTFEQSPEIREVTASEAKELLKEARLKNVPKPERDELLRQVLALSAIDTSDPGKAQMIRDDLDGGYARGWRVVAALSFIAMLGVIATALPLRASGQQERSTEASTPRL